MRKNLIYLLIILSITAIAYSPSLKNSFVNWDDDVHLYENELVRSLDWGNIKAIFLSYTEGIYAPLTILSFAVEYRFFEYNPFVYHLDNLILHLAVTALVFWLGLRLGLPRRAVGVASLLFGVHPIHVESVAWVTERKDVLYATFYMLAVHAYWTYLSQIKKKGEKGIIELPLGKQNSKSPHAAETAMERFGVGKGKFNKWILITTLLGAFSLLAKSMAVSLPFILFLLDWFSGRKIKRSVFLEKLSLMVLVVAVGGITYSAHARIFEGSVSSSVLIFVWTAVFYIRQFAFPVYFIPIHPLPQPVSFFGAEYVLSVLVAALCVVGLLVLRRARWVVFAFGFYFLSIFFLLKYDTYDVHVVADRYMYLPSVGFCFLFGFVCEYVWKNLSLEGGRLKKQRVWGVLFSFSLSGMLLAQSAWTFQQCKVWENGLTLWSHQTALAPDNDIALNNLAMAYRLAKDFPRITEEYKKENNQGVVGGGALTTSPLPGPQMPLVRHIIGLYERALRIDPQFFAGMRNLASFYQDIGDENRAALIYRRAIAINFFDGVAHFRLGRSYSALDRNNEAVKELITAVTLSPDEARMYNRVILALNKMTKEKDFDLSRDASAKIFKLYKQFLATPKAAVYLRRADFFQRKAKQKKAAQFYQKAFAAGAEYCSLLLELKDFSRRIPADS